MKADPNIFVVDASVALKWALLGEPDEEIAEQLKRDFLAKKVRLFVPTHFFVEYANILARKSSKNDLYLFSQIKLLPLFECPLTLELAEKTFALMRRHKKISFYDVLYHALAKSLKGQFITADDKYFQTVKKEGSICLLKNYSSPTKG